MTQPHIIIDGKTYWQIACKKCEKPDRYTVFFDGENGLVFRCECGNTTEWDKRQLQKHPDQKPEMTLNGNCSR